jgi:hypothetical protein
MPVPPPPRWIMKGLPVPFGPPLWTWREHHKTLSGISVSLDGKRTHPANLNPTQKREVDDFRKSISLYL